MTMHPILGKNVTKALMAAGLADELTRRVVIDIPANDLVIVYREQLGDARMLDIVGALSTDPSVQIRGVPNPESKEDSDGGRLIDES